MYICCTCMSMCVYMYVSVFVHSVYQCVCVSMCKCVCIYMCVCDLLIIVQKNECKVCKYVDVHTKDEVNALNRQRGNPGFRNS